MPYIGQEPVAGNFVLLDAITTSATATYALTKNSVAYSPESSRNMIVSLNGVTQAPEAAYTVSGSNITFSSALTASDVIDYILILGDVLDIGRPSDGVVGTDQMNYPLGNFSSTGIDDNATSTAITIDSSENVGIGTASPTSTASAGPTLEISGTAGGNLVLSDSNATSGQRAKYLLSQGGALYVGHSADNGTSPVNDLVINASGNVGIGTTSPTGFTGYTSLDINNATSGALIDLSQGDAMKGRLIATASTMAIETASSVPIIFQPAGTEAMRIDSSGQVGIGIAPYATRKLTVFGTGAGEATVMIEGEGGADPCINFLANNTQHWTLGIDDSDADKFKLSEHSALGTNDYLVVDVSGNVGIGTTSPSNTLTVNKDTGSTPTVYINNSGADPTDGPALKVQASGRGSGIADVSVFSVHNISDEIFTVRNDGNVGIGTASPARELEIRLADDTTTTLGQKGGISLYAPSNTGGNGGEITWASAVNGEVWAAISGHITANGSGVASGALVFGTGNNSALPTERMRIDSSGNLLVGTTTHRPATNNVNGVSVDATYGIEASVTSGGPLTLNRKSTDGGLISFKKDGTTLGSISAYSSAVIGINLRVSTNNSGFRGAASSIIPWYENADRDNEIDLGNASVRWDDIYATNGTIQTSDANEKQDIEALSEAETRVAVAAKALLRKFRWRSAVEEKGDEARIHFGIIAQDLQAAFEAEGLDAGDYAMFIHSTWTDEETGEERSRMGVRYSELLAFIIAAI